VNPDIVPNGNHSPNTSMFIFNQQNFGEQFNMQMSETKITVTVFEGKYPL
jgi:hypothetical protein